MVDKITNIDEFEAAWNTMLGKETELPVRCDASYGYIVVFCDAVGDNNPLWLDEAYAKKSRFGGITAPPTFLIKVSNANHGHDLNASPLAPKLATEHVANSQAALEYEMFHPIYEGDRFTVKAKITDTFRKMTKSQGMGVWHLIETYYTNQRQQLVGIIRHTMCVTSRPEDLTSGEKLPVHVPDPDKPGVVAKNADKLTAERTRRGAEPRYWEDVKEGEEMTPVEKGVYGIMNRWDINVHYVPAVLPGSGGTGEIRPKVPTPPTYLAWWGATARYDDWKRGTLGSFGQGRGADVQQHAIGPSQEKYSWLGQLVTDWMGDDGTLKKLYAQLRSQVLVGDIHVCKGKVTKKYIEGGEHLVDCDIFVENQGGRVICPGRATVALPSKKK